jgi:hypothetical protein
LLGNEDYLSTPQTPPVDHQFVFVRKTDFVDSIGRLSTAAAQVQMAVAHGLFIAWRCSSG